MGSKIQQKTIPTLYNMSSSQSHVCLWALEEVAATHSIKYHVKNLRRRDPNTPIVFGSLFPVNKSPIVTLAPFDASPEAQAAASTNYQVTPGVLTESRLILQFISDYYSAGEWIPESVEDKRRDTFFAEFAKSSLLLKVDFCVAFEVLASFLPWGLRHFVYLLVKPIVAHFIRDLNDIWGVMEGALGGEGKRWFSGSRMGMADFCMSFPMDMAVQRGYFDESKFPKVREWYGRVVGREAYKRALVKGEVYDLAKFA
ncbi:putative glutathione S-transferase [Rhexocercosporidium sp. MPI-PUGE-AT-0058]|nr:putative glutathione S-transferase [Rhexocercosporidium sp. MPI-PUGE-AT-0058]